MNPRQKWLAWGRIPAVRTALVVTGLLLMLVAPAVGLLPGPGGTIVFGVGLGLTLKYSEWAKRQYVQFKRKHPNKGRWADWGLRRGSAKRREELRKEREATASAATEIERIERSDGQAILLLYRRQAGIISFVIQRCFEPQGPYEHESYWTPVGFSGLYQDVDVARADGLRQLEAV